MKPTSSHDVPGKARIAVSVQRPNKLAELDYRALSFDYDHDGLTYDTITHGAQVTAGIEF
jgi:hypothetical protein